MTMIEYVQESYIAHEARQWRVRHDWGLGMGGGVGGVVQGLLVDPGVLAKWWRGSR